LKRYPPKLDPAFSLLFGLGVVLCLALLITAR